MEKNNKNLIHKKSNNEISKTNNLNSKKITTNVKTNIKLSQNQNINLKTNNINIKNPSFQKNKIEILPFQRNKKYASVKKRFIKDNYLYTIVYFLDPKSLFNFMLSNKQFFRIGVACDDVW